MQGTHLLHSSHCWRTLEHLRAASLSHVQQLACPHHGRRKKWGWPLFVPLPKDAQNSSRPSPSTAGFWTVKTAHTASTPRQKAMPLLRFVILKQSTDQRVGVSFVAEDEDELEYGARAHAHPACTRARKP